MNLRAGCLNCEAAYTVSANEILVNVLLHVIGILLNITLFFVVSSCSGKQAGAYKSVIRVTAASDICVEDNFCTYVGTVSVVTAFAYVAIIVAEATLLRSLRHPIVVNESTAIHIRSDFKLALLGLAVCPVVMKLIFFVGFLVSGLLNFTVYDIMPVFVVAMTTSVSIGNPLIIVFAVRLYRKAVLRRCKRERSRGRGVVIMYATTNDNRDNRLSTLSQKNRIAPVRTEFYTL